MKGASGQLTTTALAADLFGIHGGWLDRCRDAINANSLHDLEADRNIQRAFRLDSGANHASGFFDHPAPNAQVISGAVLALAKAVAGLTDAKTAAASALDVFDRAGHSSPTGFRSFVRRDESAASSLVEELEKAGPDHQSAAFVSLLVRYLSGDDLKPVRRIQVPVLFDQIGQGTSAILRITELSSGPDGLHPHPRTMTFLLADQSFRQSIRDAWAISELRTSRKCFVWEIINTKTKLPARLIKDPSLGGTWAAALDALKLRKARTKIQTRKLDPKCAITGALDGKNLATVAGYPAKIKAAAEMGLRIIYPAADEEQVTQIAREHSVMAQPAKDIDEAIRLARTRIDWAAIVMQVTAVFTATFLVVVGTITFDAFQRQSEAETKTRTASNLLFESAKIEYENPRLAGLLALASDQISSSANAKESINRIVRDNSMISESISLSQTKLWTIVSGGDIIVTRGQDGQVNGIDARTHQIKWSEKLPGSQAAISKDGLTLALRDNSNRIRVYSVEDTGPIEKYSVKLSTSLRLRQMLIDDRNAERAITLVGEKYIYVIDKNSNETKTYSLSGRPDSITLPSDEVYSVSSDWVVFQGRPGLVMSTVTGKIVFWDPNNPQATHILQTLKFGLSAQSIEMDQSHLYISSSTDGILVTDSQGDSLSQIASGDIGQISKFISLPDGIGNSTPIAALGERGLSLLSGYRPMTIKRSDITDVVAIHGTTQLAATTETGHVLFINPNYEQLGASARMQDQGARVVGFTSDGDILVEGRASIQRFIPAGARTFSNSPKLSYVPAKVVTLGSIHSSASSSRYIAAVDQDNSILIWDASTATTVVVIPAAAGSTPSSLQFIMDGTELLVSYGSEYIRISTSDWKQIAAYSIKGNVYGPSSLRYANGEVLEIDPLDGKSRLVTKLSEERELEEATIIDVMQLRESQNFAILTDYRNLSVFSQDGKSLNKSRRFSDTIHIYPSPSGRMIAAAFSNGTVEVLDAASLDTIEVLTSGSSSIIWSPDEKLMAIGNQLFSVIRMDSKTTLCSIIGTDITDKEWQDYVDASNPRTPLCQPDARPLPVQR